MTVAELEEAPPQVVLEWAYAHFERVALVASFQAESGVLIDMACRVVPNPEVITVDSGRLPEETFDIMEHFRERYPIKLRVIAPDAEEVSAMAAAHGPNLFRQSVELRLRCCDVRKVRPLRRALESYDAWITGVRRDESTTRRHTAVVSRDPVHGEIIKIAPLATWSRRDVWRYLDEHRVPRHPLYEQGYRSIGCAPCSRATRPGEHERAGRWWWEMNTVKECGLHQVMTA